MRDDEKKIVIIAPSHVRAEDWCLRQTPPVDSRSTLIVTTRKAVDRLLTYNKNGIRLVRLGFPQNGQDSEAIMEALIRLGML